MDWKPIESAPLGVEVLLVETAPEDLILIYALGMKMHTGEWHTSQDEITNFVPMYWQPLPAPPDLSPPIGLTQPEKMPGTEK